MDPWGPSCASLTQRAKLRARWVSIHTDKVACGGKSAAQQCALLSACATRTMLCIALLSYVCYLTCVFAWGIRSWAGMLQLNRTRRRSGAYGCVSTHFMSLGRGALVMPAVNKLQNAAIKLFNKPVV
eukprot:scaffold1514_cov28-Tisochrysis_lutea.AAC.1